MISSLLSYLAKLRIMRMIIIFITKMSVSKTLKSTLWMTPTLRLHGFMKTTWWPTLIISVHNFVQERRGVHSLFGPQQQFVSYWRDKSPLCYIGRLLNFKFHVTDICNRASREIKSFKRFAKYRNCGMFYLLTLNDLRVCQFSTEI